MNKWHKHFGVYGIVHKNSQILLVKKTRGPYVERYDLPGGTLNVDESILKHLEREFIEETGYKIKIIKQLGVYDFRVEEKYLDFEYIQHIAIMYAVELQEKISEVKKVIYVNDIKENNDSDGICWIDINQLSLKNASPLVLKAVSIINSKHQEINKPTDIEIYDNWTRI